MGDRKKKQQLNRIKKIEDDNKLRFLWEFMIEEHLSQQDIANILKCSRQNIAATMNNEDMKLSTLRQIAQATNREFVYYFKPKEYNQKDILDNIEENINILRELLLKEKTKSETN